MENSSRFQKDLRQKGQKGYPQGSTGPLSSSRFAQPKGTDGNDISKISVTCQDVLPQGWEEYRASHPQDSFYHDPGWEKVIRACFGHGTYFLAARAGNSLRGILPLVFLKSRIFGRALVSMPYFNYGGILADDDAAAHQLISSALNLKDKLSADYVELRQTAMLRGGWPVKSNKVIMLLSLPGDPEELWRSLKSKLRSQIRRPEKEGCSFHWGQAELLKDFYLVFAENMRDLGTPVYPESFFQHILAAFPQQTNIAVVRLGDLPIAAGFLLRYRNKMEIPWASSRRRYNRLSPNMLLYWGVLKQAILKSLEHFDFGRSTRDSNTYKFKQQWGAVPHETYWYYPGQDQTRLPNHDPQSAKYYWATSVWRKLPLFITNNCGPWIVKNIP